METLEDVIKSVDEIGMVEHENGIDHIFNVILYIEEDGDCDTWRILDYFVMNWQYGNPFNKQPQHYQDFFSYLFNDSSYEEGNTYAPKIKSPCTIV